MNRLCITLLLIASAFLCACHKNVRVTSVQTEAIAIDASTDAIQDSAYLAQLAPLTEQLNAELDYVIGYAPEPLIIHQPECPMLNWASDALLAKARQYYPGKVDIAIVNIGGMRAPWEAGEIKRRHIFELMPFDNELVVLTLAGEDIIELCQIFAEDGGQGVAGLRMVAEDKQLADVTIDGMPVEKDAYYHVATSDYLAGGTDHMIPLTRAVETWKSDMKIRDLYMDYVTEQKTVVAVVDGRMTIN